MKRSFDTYHTLGELKAVFPYIYSGGNSDSFFMAFVNESAAPDAVTRPFSFEGIILLYCVEGKAQVIIDHDQFEIEGNSVAVVFPGAHLTVRENFPLSQYNLAFLALTLDTINLVPFDFKNVLPAETLIYRRAVVRLERDVEGLLRKQISLANAVSAAGMTFSNEIAGCMLSVVFLMLVDESLEPVRSIIHAIFCLLSEDERLHPSPQTLTLVSRFVQLLKENFKQHREISFYSERLGLNANNLSQRLKSVSGRNASTWIDTYLLSEAKKQLLFTSKSILDISEELSFSSQAAFAKYFKQKTGLTPTDFRLGQSSDCELHDAFDGH